ncbi:DUF5067 domain-containing protein [Companilactobacillus jidongensis]|uniref:DUF5067 domain-containing protein n=1 Tax=Companilactobacillus jidongensis TaxID=2486006 RepID=UPI0013DDDD8E|nr:DUF5067 domain-containing protein [Companilactobacillus jidongensis]
MDRRTNRENRKRSSNTQNNNRDSNSRVQRNMEQSTTSNSRSARGAVRRQNTPFYQKNSFIISMIIAAIVIIVVGLIIWRVNVSKNTAPKSNNIEKVQSSKKTTPKKKAKKSTKQAAQKATDETKDKAADKKADSKTNSVNNAGTYNKLSYDTDWFTFKISNDVKLVKDANGDAALLVKYNYTNKTQTPEIPQQVQANSIILKQDDKQLDPTSATGDYADLVNASNTQQVQTGKNFDGALLVKVNNTDSDVNMYFRNIKTNDLMDTMQPFKLK